MDRRTFIAGAVGVTVGLAGCAATQEEFEFDATPGRFAEDAVTAAGYERLERREIVEERTREVNGQEREVTVTSYATPYRRRIELAGQERPLAAALVFTTPSISILGQEFNPVADWSRSELLDAARGRMGEQLGGGEVRAVSAVEERPMTVLDTETTVGVFEGVTDVEGTELTLRMLVTRVEHDDDYVLVAAAYPEQLRSEERPRAERLFRNVEHG